MPEGVDVLDGGTGHGVAGSHGESHPPDHR
jgi:hypothetical protein